MITKLIPLKILSIGIDLEHLSKVKKLKILIVEIIGKRLPITTSRLKNVQKFFLFVN